MPDITWETPLARQLAAHLIQDSLHELGKNRQQNIARFRKSFPEASVETIQTACRKYLTQSSKSFNLDTSGSDRRIKGKQPHQNNTGCR